MDTEDWAIGTVLILVYGELGMWRLGTAKGEHKEPSLCKFVSRIRESPISTVVICGPTGTISEYIDKLCHASLMYNNVYFIGIHTSICTFH